ncbi:unnamed protein product [Triticum turgidum subsp. durum]|uniref:LisH domain-containing protein n=1 Tax=Triticum turgidum subsp. durum TaxID=4567 RepID=A0A9R0TS76_TRITD|nr:unnamed protein product [Triticum turgidum subsp. durum]
MAKEQLALHVFGIPAGVGGAALQLRPSRTSLTHGGPNLRLVLERGGHSGYGRERRQLRFRTGPLQPQGARVGGALKGIERGRGGLNKGSSAPPPPAPSTEEKGGRPPRGNGRDDMDDYAREMMELKTLVTRTLEKKGVLAKIRAELRASVFEAIEEEDRVIEENEDGGNPALLGSCNDRAKQLHASPSVSITYAFNVEGLQYSAKCFFASRLLTALIGEYLEWAQLSHTMKVYLPECNLPKDFWKNELKDFSNKNGAEGSRSAESGPMLLDVLEGYLKYENLSQTRMAGRRMINSEPEPTLNTEHRNMRRPPSSSSIAGMPPMGRQMPPSQTSDRRGGSSASNTRKDEYNWGYDADDLSEEVLRTSTALENIQLDRKARNLTTSWRHPGSGAE